MVVPTTSPDRSRPRRLDRLIRELDHDPYHSKRKIKGPALCPSCGAAYSRGRWTHQEPAPDATRHTCPACQRIRDKVPAAFLTLRGDFPVRHENEIMRLIRNLTAKRFATRPLVRIMDQVETDDGIEFTFTDARLARSIGEALHHAYEGEIDYEYGKGDIMLRVTWTR